MKSYIGIVIEPDTIMTPAPLNFMNMKMYSVKEASRLMGISGQRVRKLLAEGRLRGKKLGNGYWVVLSLEYKRKRGDSL